METEFYGAVKQATETIQKMSHQLLDYAQQAMKFYVEFAGWVKETHPELEAEFLKWYKEKHQSKED